MEYEQILFERVGPVAIVTLNRPEKLNAFTWKMIHEILGVLDEVALDDGTRALVITGAGRAFSAGDDIGGAFYQGSPWEDAPARPPFALSLQIRLHSALRRLRKPVIAMINGLAHGMGSDVALACDFRIAAEEARLGDIRMQRAILPGTTGGPFLMPQVVGLAKAVELLLTGDTIDAREAERIGLVTRTVPAAELRNAVMEFANRLAAGPTKAIGITKAQVYGQWGMTMEQAWAHAALTLEPVEDNAEGISSFREKRAPKYTGR